MSNTVIENLNILFSEIKILTVIDKVPGKRILICDQQNIVTKKAFQDVKSSIIADRTGTLTLIKASGFEVKENIYANGTSIIQVMSNNVCIYFMTYVPKSEVVESNIEV
jgi:hypothetical protein